MMQLRPLSQRGNMIAVVMFAASGCGTSESSSAPQRDGAVDALEFVDALDSANETADGVAAVDSFASEDTAPVSVDTSAPDAFTVDGCESTAFTVAEPGTKPVVDNTSAYVARCLRIKPMSTVVFQGSAENMPTDGKDGPFGLYIVDGVRAEVFFAGKGIYPYHSKADSTMRGVIWVAD